MPMRTMSSPLAATRSQVSPVARPLSPGAAPTAVAPTGSKASQTPMEGMALEFGGRAGFVEGLGDDGEGAVAADGEAEPVGLADLAEAARPQAAGGHGARGGLGADGVLIAAHGGVGDGDGEGLRAAGGQVGDGDGVERAGGRRPGRRRRGRPSR